MLDYLNHTAANKWNFENSYLLISLILRALLSQLGLTIKNTSMFAKFPCEKMINMDKLNNSSKELIP